MSKKKLVTIKQSKIPNAGKGVFAATNIKANTRLGEYSGRQFTRLRDMPILHRPYAFRVTIAKNGRRSAAYIDGKNKRNIMGIVNGAKTKGQRRRINVKAYQYNSKIFYKSTKDIPEGEELIVSYGPTYNYWSHE